MFPNIRLTIVALLASVVGIGCGLTLFAAFRVNREPFAHLSNGGAPLQLVFAAPAPTMADRMDRMAAPFGVRFAVNATSAASVPLKFESAAPEAPPPAPTAKAAASEVAVQSPASQSPAINQAVPASAPAADAKTEEKTDATADAKTDATADAKADAKADAEVHVARHRAARGRRRRRQAATAAPPDGQLPQPAAVGPNIR
jgi:hypothetical protein